MNKKETISKRENFGQTFLVKNSLDNYNWEITREKSNILGYEVRKATALVKNKKVTAWYALKINIKDGPDTYVGLPGLILKIEVQHTKDKDKKYYFIAENIEVVNDKNLVEKPTEGKVVTQEEFSELMEEQMKKFREMHSEGVDTAD